MVNTRLTRGNFQLASMLIAAGIAISTLTLKQVEAHDRMRMAQATPVEKPAESKPGGTRPTTPAPEPAQPNPEAQKEGAKPALPPAPAEKIAPPIKEREK